MVSEVRDEERKELLEQAAACHEDGRSWTRRLTVICGVAGVAAIYCDKFSHPTGHLLGIIFALVVTVPLTYPFMHSYHRRAIWHIVVEPKMYADGYRTFGRTRATRSLQSGLAIWLAFPMVLAPTLALALLGRVMHLVGLGPLSPAEGMLTILLVFMALTIVDVFVWSRRGRPELLARTGIDSEALAHSRGLHWIWWWGWVMEASPEHSA